ncbi:MAG TPA: J domain-containing protein [Terracidiphilus sp.]|nr:J domain-containing protein [Terracidiphilus sp.]
MREISDYYEFLQISPSASSETIHRIYRFWAARYHPDNPETGNDEMFYLLRTAYDVLSDPERRASYDALRGQPASISSAPLSSIVDFMDELEGETNRRLALLAILYCRRRSNPRDAEVSLRDLEAILGFPRDYLDFTTWYLVQKGFMKRADNSNFTITVAGVDFVETQRVNLPVLNGLLTIGRLRLAEPTIDRRVGPRDRRIGLPDTRLVKVERRLNRGDRRINRDVVHVEPFCVNDIDEKVNGSADLEPDLES